ncbi:hypothetical protein [Sporosarcina sp. 179-K 8C2 HS]
MERIALGARRLALDAELRTLGAGPLSLDAIAEWQNEIKKATGFVR